jgi:hypothetical protein
MLLFQRYEGKYFCHRILIRENLFFIYGATAYQQVTEYLVDLFGSNFGITRVSVEEVYVLGSLEYKKLVDTEKQNDICHTYYLYLRTMFGMKKIKYYVMVLCVVKIM